LRELVYSDESSQRLEIQVVCWRVKLLLALTVSPMTTVTVLILTSLFALTIAATQDVVPVRKLPLVRIVETSIDLHSFGITANS
jgi:hypothetical protein